MKTGNNKQDFYIRSLEYFASNIETSLEILSSNYKIMLDSLSRQNDHILESWVDMVHNGKNLYDSFLDFNLYATSKWITLYKNFPNNFYQIVKYQKIEINPSIYALGKNPNHEFTAREYLDIGVSLYNQGLFLKSKDYFEKSLIISLNEDDKLVIASCYDALGLCYDQFSDHEKAIKYYNKTLEIAKEINNKEIESRSYNNLGSAYIDYDNFDKAIEYQNKALDIAKEVIDVRMEGTCYIGFGDCYRHKYRYDKAVDYYEKALRIFDRFGDKYEKMRCFRGLGNVYKSLYNKNKAIQYFQNALEIVINIGDKPNEGRILGDIGGVHADALEHHQAIEHHLKSLEIALQLGIKDGEGKSYSNLGNIYFKISDYSSAIDYYQKGIEVFVDNKDKESEGACYSYMGAVYTRLGNFSKALDCFEKSLKILSELDKKKQISECLNNIGSLLLYTSSLKPAKNCFEESLKIAKDMGFKRIESRNLVNLGLISTDSQDYEGAILYYQEAMDIALEMKDIETEYFCYGGLGKNYYESGNYEKSIDNFTKGLYLAQQWDNKGIAMHYYENLGHNYFKIKKYDKALDFLEKAINIQESIGIDLAQEEHKLGYYAIHNEGYLNLINLLILLNKTEKAFEYLERGKSRTFNEMISRTSYLRPSLKEINKEYQVLLHQEEDLINKLKHKQLQIEKTNEPKNIHNITSTINPIDIALHRSLSQELEKITDDLSVLYENIKQYDDEYTFIRKSKKDPDLLNFIQKNILQNENKEKSKNIVIIDYLIDNFNKKIYIFLISVDSLNVELVDTNGFDLNQIGDLYMKAISSPPASNENNNGINNERENKTDNSRNYLKYAKELSKYLIDPIKEYLYNVDLIYFVPYGRLHQIPLHTLLLNDVPLIVNYKIAYLPSASLLKFIKNKGTGSLKNCLSCGVEFVEEAKEIKNIIDPSANSIYKKEPTKKELVEILDVTSKHNDKKTKKEFDIIHFSCHGHFNNQDPMASGLLLPGEFLRAREILGLKIFSELVTLSACETGINENIKGEELMGLTRSFIYAGAASVLVSLWKVHSKSTRILMIEFYKQLKKPEFTDLATVLQTAQKNVMRTKEYNHPYYWAPFVLVGDWK